MGEPLNYRKLHGPCILAIRPCQVS